MLLLNEQDIRKVFDMNDAIDSNIEAYKIFSSGNAVVPLRQVIAADEGRGNFAFMPAYSSKLGVIESVVKQQLLGRFYSWMTRTGKY